MSHYEKLTILLAAIAIAAAFFIGYLQNSINQKLVDINYEPSLSISYAKPIADAADMASGLMLRNEGKTNITFYSFSLFPNKIMDNERIFKKSDPGVISSGGSVGLVGNPQGSDFLKIIEDLIKEGKGPNFLLDVVFKTPDSQKYLMETSITGVIKDGMVKAYFAGSIFRKFDWKLVD